MFFFGELLETMPQALQTFSSCGLEPIRYCIRPVIWWSCRKALTVVGVSPFGSTDTATI